MIRRFGWTSSLEHVCYFMLLLRKKIHWSIVAIIKVVSTKEKGGKLVVDYLPFGTKPVGFVCRKS